MKKKQQQTKADMFMDLGEQMEMVAMTLQEQQHNHIKSVTKKDIITARRRFKLALNHLKITLPPKYL